MLWKMLEKPGISQKVRTKQFNNTKVVDNIFSWILTTNDFFIDLFTIHCSKFLKSKILNLFLFDTWVDTLVDSTTDCRRVLFLRFLLWIYNRSFLFRFVVHFFVCDDLFDVTCSACKYSYDAMLQSDTPCSKIFQSSECSSSIEISVLQHTSCSFIHVTYNWIFYVLNFSTLSSVKKRH